MFKFLHISDLHFGETPNHKMLARLGKIHEEYRDHRLIVTGDVTDNGGSREYVNAMYSLPLLLSVVPGNHDYCLAGNLYDRKRAARFREHFSPGFWRWHWPTVEILRTTTEKVALIGLDTNIRSIWPFDFARGKLGLWQRRKLSGLLRKYKDYVTIVYMHHHPFDRGFATAMSDADKVFHALTGADVVCFGHKHKACVFHHKSGPQYIAAGRFDECDEVTEITVGSNAIFGLRQVPIV